MDKITVAIAGTPNCGKTTLFNALTGGNQKIGNWPGVTVEEIRGQTSIEKTRFEFIDLPGIYSLTAHSDDERVTRDFLLSKEAELVVNIVDAVNLEQNLYLTSQLVEMQVPLIVIVNRIDMAAKRNININFKELAKKIGCPVIPISAVKNSDVAQLKSILKEKAGRQQAPLSNISYPNEVNSVIKKWSRKLQPVANKLGITNGWIGIKLLEGDSQITEITLEEKVLTQKEIEMEVHKIEKIHKEEIDIVIADYRYGYIHGLAKDVVHRHYNKKEITDKIDSVVLNNLAGIPIFFAVMYLTFIVAINVGGIFIDFFDILFGGIFVDGTAALLQFLHAPEFLTSILSLGLGTGIQTVATFVPIIFFMFFMLAILEDSGYMARAAFVMDKFMRILGLPGKSFVPMIIGFGCTVPAVMGTRILESRRDKLLTIFLTPFMSCGAKLPVYVLFGAAFFPNNSGLMVFSLYMAGIAASLITGLVLKNTMYKGESTHFVMELPTYNMPRLKHIMIHTWLNLREFIFRAGVLIVAAVSLLSILNSVGTDGTLGNEGTEKSLLSQAGMKVVPVFAPMGLDKQNWPAAVALISGLFAKESIVITMNSLYSQGKSNTVDQPATQNYSIKSTVTDAFTTLLDQTKEFSDSLLDPFGFSDISSAKNEENSAEVLETDSSIFMNMRKHFSKGPMQAYAYLLFVLLYFPCIGAFGALLKEVGVPLGISVVSYATALAWIIATLFYQIVIGHSIFWLSAALIMFGLIYLTFYIIGKKNKYLEVID